MIMSEEKIMSQHFGSPGLYRIQGEVIMMIGDKAHDSLIGKGRELNECIKMWIYT